MQCMVQTGVSSKEAVVKGTEEVENLFGITAELQFTDRRKANLWLGCQLNNKTEDLKQLSR